MTRFQKLLIAVSSVLLVASAGLVGATAPASAAGVRPHGVDFTLTTSATCTPGRGTTCTVTGKDKGVTASPFMGPGIRWSVSDCVSGSCATRMSIVLDTSCCGQVAMTGTAMGSTRGWFAYDAGPLLVPGAGWVQLQPTNPAKAAGAPGGPLVFFLTTLPDGSTVARFSGSLVY